MEGCFHRCVSTLFAVEPDLTCSVKHSHIVPLWGAVAHVLLQFVYVEQRVAVGASVPPVSCIVAVNQSEKPAIHAGETRIGLFTTRAVRENDELTYDYQFQHAGLHAAAQGFRCMCGTPNCRGTMDINPERSRDMGRRLRVKWDGDEVWYEGYVLRFNPSNGKHTVYYPVEGSNGTQETLSLDDVEFEWVEDQFLPLCPTQPTVTAPGTHPVLPPAAQVQGAVGVLQQAAAAAMLPINPKTGRVVGDAAAEATVARNEVTNANRAASGSISQPERLQSIAPPPAVPTLHTHVLGPIQSGSNMDTVNAGVRVALPRPLPQRPLADDATAAKDGLDLLSAVAASLPERSHTPPPEPTGVHLIHHDMLRSAIFTVATSTFWGAFVSLLDLNQLTDMSMCRWSCN